MVPARPFFIGSDGCDRSSAWTWDFSSMHSTIAFSGGLRYSPTTSVSFSSNAGSVETLNVSTRCGLRPRVPDALHRGSAHPGVAGHRPCAPMRFAFRLGVQRVVHDLLHLLRGDRRLRSPPGAHLPEFGQAVLGEPGP